METMLISGNTHPGKRRKQNQDAYSCSQLWSAEKALLAVVDGVGGYTGGEKAAAIARDSIEQYMQNPKGDTLTMLREAVIYANNRIVEERKKDQQVSEMWCVLTALVADSETQSICYAHVGDTRLYRYRNGSLQKLTKDHSFVGIKEDAGEITELEAMAHPHRNQILREVGSAPHRLDDEDFMDYGREDLLPGDLLLLCSDGLTDMITMQQMTAILSTGQPLAGKVNNLITLANEMGGHDNITVVLLQHQIVAPQKTESPEPPVFTGSTEAGPQKSATKGGKSKYRLFSFFRQLRTHSPFSTHHLLFPVLLLLLIAGAGWYFSPPKKSGVTPTVTTIIDSNHSLPAGRINHPAVPGPVIELKTDTLRITSTQNWEHLKQYADSTGKAIVLMPAKKGHRRFAAVEITGRSAQPGDTLLIRNLRIKDFETGIKINIPVLLKTENLVFDNIRYPFNNLVKPDSSHTSVLIMNNVKR
jgi:serine/threonine protein phosphatase PrpC